MKKIAVLFLALFGFLSQVKSQQFQYYLDNHLIIQNGNGHAIPFPFAGGIISPQFNECDLNFDGIMDLVIFDRSGNRILTYINDNKPGISSYYYAPHYQDAFPELHSWVLMADYNRDGKMDIFTEANGFYYPFNVAVYKNTSANGKISFQKIYEPLQNIRYEYKNGELDTLYDIQNTVYALNMDYPAITDIDHDGDLDFISYGNFGTTVHLYQNIQIENGLSNDTMLFALADECWGGFTEGATSSSIDLGQDCSSPRFYKKSSAHEGSTILLFDNDKDQDMDALIGDVSTSNIIFLKNGKSDLNYGIDTMITVESVFPAYGKQAKVNVFPATFYIDVNNDGVKDLLVSPNVSTAKNIHQVFYYQNMGENDKPVFDFKQDDFIQQHMLDLGSGAVPVFWDADGDGKTDLLVANKGDFDLYLGSKDRLTFYKNISPVNDSFIFKETDTNFFNLMQYQISEMKPSFGDLNGDGKADMIIGCTNGTLYYFENTSTNAQNPSFNLVSSQYKGIDVGSVSAPQIIDLDNDGLNDLVIGNSRGFIQFYKNIGSSNNADFSFIPTIDSLGKFKVNSYFLDSLFDNMGDLIGFDTLYSNSGYASPHFADLDNNGTLELLVGSDHGKLYAYSDIENNLNGKFEKINNLLYRPYFNDFNDTRFGGRIVPVSFFDPKSQKRNIMVGNYNGGLHFLRNSFGTTDTSSVASVQKFQNPCKIYPNPADKEIRIELLNAQESITQIRVYDAQGKLSREEILPYSKITHHFSVENLPDGIYTLQIFTKSQKVFRQKIVVIK